MNNIKRQLDKIFQGYNQHGINDKLAIFFDITCLLMLKSLEDYPKAGFISWGFDKYIKGRNETCNWSTLLAMNIDEVQQVFLSEILPSFYKSLKELGLEYIESTKLNIQNASINYGFILGIINDIFTLELDGESVNKNNIMIYDDIFENLLGYLANFKFSSRFNVPKHLKRLLCELISVRQKDMVYDPNMGDGSLLIEAYKCMVYSDIPPYRIVKDDDGFSDVSRYNKNLIPDYFRRSLVLEGSEKVCMFRWISFMNFYFHRLNLQQPQFAAFNKNEKIKKDKYNKILCIHPLNGYFDNLNDVMEHLKPMGKAAVVVPQLFLYGDSKKVQKLRKRLLAQFCVEAVITLPKYEFCPFSQIATAVVIFSLADEVNFEKSKVWLCNLKNDGYSNDRKRAKTSDTPLPILLDAFHIRKEMDTEWFECKNISLQDILNNGNSLFVDEYIDYEKEPEVEVDPLEIIESLEKLGDNLKKGIEELKLYI